MAIGKHLILFCLIFVIIISFKEALSLSIECPKGDICELAGQKIKIVGIVTSLTSQRLERTILEVDIKCLNNNIETHCNASLQKSKIQVTLPHTQYNFQYGDKLVLEGKLKIPKQNQEDNFSYPLYLAGRKIYSVMENPEVVLYMGNDNQETLYKHILGFREKVRQIINNNLTEPDASILNAMIIGDQGGVPKELRKKLSEVGIIHILSVSGTHVTLLIAIIAFLVVKVTSRRFIALVLVSLGVIFYLLLAGSPNCASRSAIMGLLAFLALYKGKNPNLKTALWLSATVLLYLNPSAIFSDIGFQLSFLAIIGMVYVYPLFDKCFTWGRLGFLWNLLRVFLLSISISLTTNPLVFYYFGIISWISPIANLILLPLFSAILPAGFLLVIFGSISILNNLIAFSIQVQLNFILYLVGLLLKIPSSFTESTVKSGWILLYYVGLFFIVLIWRFTVKKYIFPRRLDYFESEEFLNSHVETPACPVGRQNFVSLQKKIKKINVLFKNIDKVAFFLLSVAGCMLLISVSYLYSSSLPPRLIVLDVGQGDSFLLDWPKYHLQILIDGGPGRNVLPELGQALPFYDRKVEMLILSHPHQDHIEGLINVIERYKVSRVVLNSLPQNNVETQNFASLQNVFLDKLIKNKIPISISQRGQEILLGSEKEKVAELEFLTPFFDYSKNKITDVNDQSAVLKMNHPRKILFMGDSSQKVEQAVLDKESRNLQIEILKIAHHGSRFSSSNKFLDAVQPKTALISAGKGNLFGHPAQNTVKKLEERSIKIFRTDLDGRIELSLQN